MSLEQEKIAIKQTIQYFFDGIDTLDKELMKKAFYGNQTQFLSKKDSEEYLNESNLEHFLKMVAHIKNDSTSIFNKEQCKKEILYIDVTGVAAAAKISLTFSTFAYTDYYNLLKINGTWLIVNKTFNTEVF